MQAPPVPALKSVGAVSTFKITTATEATSVYFNILLFPSQIKHTDPNNKQTMQFPS